MVNILINKDNLKKNLVNGVKHFKLICNHKFWVMYYCNKCGITWRGIKHDLSKFTPTEFIESVKYFDGKRSPIDVCKEQNGVSQAWMHHKGRNTHHYEYWQDNFDRGGHPVQMPFEDAVEMLCDYLGAGRAYSGKDFSYSGEYMWWKNKIANGIAMHPQTQMFIDEMLKNLMNNTNNYGGIDNILCKNSCWYTYIRCEEEYKKLYECDENSKR